MPDIKLEGYNSNQIGYGLERLTGIMCDVLQKEEDAALNLHSSVMNSMACLASLLSGSSANDLNLPIIKLNLCNLNYFLIKEIECKCDQYEIWDLLLSYRHHYRDWIINAILPNFNNAMFISSGMQDIYNLFSYIFVQDNYVSLVDLLKQPVVQNPINNSLQQGFQSMQAENHPCYGIDLMTDIKKFFSENVVSINFNRIFISEEYLKKEQEVVDRLVSLPSLSDKEKDLLSDFFVALNYSHPDFMRSIIYVANPAGLINKVFTKKSLRAFVDLSINRLTDACASGSIGRILDMLWTFVVLDEAKLLSSSDRNKLDSVSVCLCNSYKEGKWKLFKVIERCLNIIMCLPAVDDIQGVGYAEKTGAEYNKEYERIEVIKKYINEKKSNGQYQVFNLSSDQSSWHSSEHSSQQSTQKIQHHELQNQNEQIQEEIQEQIQAFDGQLQSPIRIYGEEINDIEYFTQSMQIDLNIKFQTADLAYKCSFK